MKYKIEKEFGAVIFTYRVYHRQGTEFKTYVAKIIGPHPNYYLERFFDYRMHKSNSRFDTFGYVLETGIYEFVVKRYAGNQLISKDRQWIVVDGTDVYSYDGDEMNYMYVLYTQFLLSQKKIVHNDKVA